MKARSSARRSSIVILLIAVTAVTLGFWTRGWNTVRADEPPILGAYLYHYMPDAHLQTLADHGFSTALIKIIAKEATAELIMQVEARAQLANTLGMAVVPVVNAYNPSVMAELAGSGRFFRDRHGAEHPGMPCPADTVYWSAWWESFTRPVLDAAGCLALDLEIYGIDGVTHWPPSPCTCRPCVLEYTGYDGANEDLAVEWLDTLGERDLEDLAGWQLQKLAAFFTAHLDVLGASAQPLAVLDLGRPGLVSRALCLALERLGQPVVDFTELTYSRGQRVSIDEITATYRGLELEVETVAGLWLLKWSPESLAEEGLALTRDHGGYWIFTSLSLHLHPDELDGAYQLRGDQASYWTELGGLNARLR